MRRSQMSKLLTHLGECSLNEPLFQVYQRTRRSSLHTGLISCVGRLGEVVLQTPREILMRKTLVTAFAAATVLSVGMLGNSTGAMAFVAESPSSIAAGDAGLVQKAALHCDWFLYFECWRVPGYYQPHRYGWHHRHRWHR